MAGSNDQYLFNIEGYQFFGTINANIKEDEVLIRSPKGSNYVLPVGVMKEFLNRLENDAELKEMFGQNK